MTMDQKIIAKIKALLAKCEPGANATEAEVDAARAKAFELMEKYNIDQLAVDLNGEVKAEKVIIPRHVYRGVDMFDWLTIPVADFTHCRNWRQERTELRGKRAKKGQSRDDSVFFGLPSDLIFAEWLLNMYVDYVKRWHDITWTEKTLAGEYLYPHWSRDFIIGACSGIASKLRDETARHRNQAKVGSGVNALVVQSLVDQQMREFYPSQWNMIMTRRGIGHVAVGNAFQAGRAAGAGAGTARPVGGGQKFLK